MDLREIDASGPFKRSSRMPLDAVVRLHFEGTVAYQNGFAANVSATGMFVKHPDPPGLGTRLVFEFVIGEQRKPVQGAGIVAWVRERYEGPGRPAGIGIQFTEVDAQSRQHVAEALFEYLEMSLGAESPDAGEEAPAAARGRALEPLPPELEASLSEAQEPAPAPVPEPPPAPLPPARPTRSFAMATPVDGIEAQPDFSPAIPPDAAPAAADTRRATFSYATPSAEPEVASAETDDERIDRLVRAALSEEPLVGVETGAAASVKPSRSLPLWVWIAAGFVLLGAGWAGWQYWLAPGAKTERLPPAATASAAPTPAPRPPLSAVAAPQTTLADAVGATDAARTAPEIPLPRGVAPPAEPDAEGEPSEGAPVAAAATPPATAPAATPAPDAATDRSAPAVEPMPTEEGQPRARAVNDIDWTEATGVTVVTIAGDGPFPAGSFSYSEIGGEKARVLVRFKGLELPYRKASLPVGTAAVSGIRTGWHDRPGGAEQHIVIDLAGAHVRLEGFEALGSRIVLKLAAR